VFLGGLEVVFSPHADPHPTVTVVVATATHQFDAVAVTVTIYVPEFAYV
jgi:hypothetical protein